MNWAQENYGYHKKERKKTSPHPPFQKGQKRGLKGKIHSLTSCNYTVFQGGGEMNLGQSNI